MSLIEIGNSAFSDNKLRALDLSGLMNLNRDWGYGFL